MPEPTAKLIYLGSHEDRDFWELLEKYRNKPIIGRHPEALTAAGKFQGRIIIEVFHQPGSRNDTGIAMAWDLPDSVNPEEVFKNVAEDLMSRTSSESRLHNQSQEGDQGSEAEQDNSAKPE
jgi:hypothetical protein